MWRADQDKRPMLLTIFGTVTALVILSLLWWIWHDPTERQQVTSTYTSGAPAQRSEPMAGTATE